MRVCVVCRRLLAFLSGGGDPFISLAADWQGLPYDRVTPDLRARAKQCVYGIIYGMYRAPAPPRRTSA